LTDIFDLYRDPQKHDELKAILNLGAQKHPAGLAQNFLEKDIWVAEALRLLYDENLLGAHSTAFKGGTALSKCWRAIERFSEDIDLSIHWSDLAGEPDEIAAWEQSTQSNSQKKKFRDRQTKLLTEWSENLVDRLNERLAEYEIEGLRAELEPDSKGEKVNVHFPRLSSYDSNYQLDYILLSPALARTNARQMPDIVRNGQPYRTIFPPGQEVERFPRTGWDRPKASDHCPVAITLDMV